MNANTADTQGRVYHVGGQDPVSVASKIARSCASASWRSRAAFSVT